MGWNGYRTNQFSDVSGRKVLFEYAAGSPKLGEGKGKQVLIKAHLDILGEYTAQVSQALMERLPFVIFITAFQPFQSFRTLFCMDRISAHTEKKRTIMQEISKCMCSGYALVRYFRNFQQASLKILFQSFFLPD